MPKTMLIDATHVEETRVAVVDGNRLVEYDYESKVRKQLKGSVFLAKVTRVEPSLQAAFVNFGGNRHGFLPFSEIHPDYFRIPVADREALIAAQQAELEEHDNELEQAEAAIEQRAAEGEAAESSSDDEEEDDEEEEIEAIVEVGGEDQPLIGDEEEEDDEEETASDDDSDDEEDEESDEEDDDKRPMLMASNEDVILGPSVDEEIDSSDNQGDDDVLELSPDDFAEEDNSTDQPDEQAMREGGEGEQSAIEGAEGERGRGGRERGGRGRGRDRNRGRGGRNGGGRGRHGSADRDDRGVDSIGGDGVDGDRPFRFNLKRSYKIQEVIKRGQIMLIQVSKEERGNKGAAVTTYLSMPGRYCVLMPNSPRGGGVSRKIASFKDRKRMKEMLDDLSVPEGMSVILRTAGVTRTKVEIKRDLDYLTRLWNTIREHTLQSTAPALIYEEGNLIKRAIRDLYSRDIEDVYVSGDEGFKAARDFMKMLMPSHAKKVQEYKNDRVPMFHKFGVENQIADMGEPTVNLKSGGYLVINPTEALVSVDVNSGRATKERHIEDTALKTNLEAADEVARQLRLRDLGGLVVIDFIDMEDRRNNRKVEQRLRDALSTDRARIQVGRISSFGLLELSRQRLNPSLAEAQQEVCAHCAGTGRVKTLDFSAISVLRALEVEGIKGKNTDICLTMAPSVVLYIMNNKRRLLNDIEARYGFAVSFITDETMSTSQFKLETVARSAPKISEGITSVAMDVSNDDDISEGDIEEGDDEEAPVISQNNERGERSERNNEERGEGGKRRRGRRGGRGRGRDRGDRGPRPEGDASSDESHGNVIATENFPDDDIGNRAPSEDARDDNRGNREPREGREGGRRRRGGRGRGRGGERGDRGPRENSNGNAQPRLREDHPPHVEPQVHAAPPIQVVARPSNDRQPVEVSAPRDYEKVNQAPEKKKKGWWNKLVE